MKPRRNSIPTGLLLAGGLAALLAASGHAATKLRLNAAEVVIDGVCTAAHNAGTARYLRADASGANNGTNWMNAWTSLSTAETNTKRGQTVCVADGTYAGTQTFNTPTMGTTYITFRKATASDHGTETGWDSSYGDGTAVFSDAWTFDTGYWDFDGAVGGGPGDAVGDWPSSWTTGHGFEQSSAANTYNVTLCDTDDTKTMSGFRFKHMRFTNGTSLTYSGMASSGWFRAENKSGCNIDDVIVEYIYTNEAMGVPFHVWNSHDWTIQYSYFSSNGKGNDVNFHRELWSAINNDRWVWRWNYIRSINNTGVFGYVNDGDAGESVEVYGNIFIWETGDQVPGYFMESDVDLPNWRVFNNTVVGWNNSINSWGCPGNNLVGRETGSITRNNIIAHHPYVQFGGCMFVWGTASHDGFYSIIYQGTTNVTANYAAASSNSQTFRSSPFVNFPSDLRLRAATNAGSSADSPSGNSVDMFGCTRGGDGTWDRGALEYGC